MEPIKSGRENSDVTTLLHRIKLGDPGAASEIMPLIYNELHAIAGRHMRQERKDHTLQATVLVDKAFMRLAGDSKIEWQNRAHFFAVASSAMRRVLIDYARAAKAEKRPKAHQQVELESGLAALTSSRSISWRSMRRWRSWQPGTLGKVRLWRCDFSLGSVSRYCGDVGHFGSDCETRLDDGPSMALCRAHKAVGWVTVTPQRWEQMQKIFEEALRCTLSGTEGIGTRTLRRRYQFGS